MSEIDPARHWDGQRWLWWNGAAWVPEGGLPAALPPPAPGPSWSGPTAWSRPEPVAAPPLVPHPGYAPAYGAAPLMLTDRRDRGGMAVVAWIFTILSAFYFLPWAIAATRGKADAGSIGLINWLLGWTGVGWIVALVMACTAHRLLTPLAYGARY